MQNTFITDNEDVDPQKAKLEGEANTLRKEKLYSNLLNEINGEFLMLSSVYKLKFI